MSESTLRAQRIVPALGVIAVFWLACADAASAGGAASAPQLVVGDHWQYRVTDRLRRGAQSQLDAEVIAVSGGRAQIRYHRSDSSGGEEWIDEVDSQGGLTSGSLNHEPSRPLNPPAQLLQFPLDTGKTWNQVIDTVRRDTGLKDQILVYGKVEGAQATTVPAGTFDATYVYRILQLDDSEAWRSRTTLRQGIWYAPAVKGSVKEERAAQYTQTPPNPVVRTEYLLLELQSFRPGGQ